VPTARPPTGPHAGDGGGREFLHLDKPFVDFNEIRREIEQEMYSVAGVLLARTKASLS
jgi:hypothetical protein